MKYLLLISLALLFSCHSEKDEPPVLSMQIVDRNGFSETINSKERISSLQKNDFLSTQPYQKVVRVFGKSAAGQTNSKVTTYHSNGQLWQYLEVVSGRAHGAFREWHPNGIQKIEAHVIEGTPDTSEAAQVTWLFDGESAVWDDAGNRVAEIHYEKGLLEGPSLYYHSSGALEKVVPYVKDVVDGTVAIYNPEGTLIEKMEFKAGLQDGLSWGPHYTETYREGKLLSATYPSTAIIDGTGKKALFQEGKLHSLIEYHDGVPKGEVQLFSPNGDLLFSYQVLDDKKEGDEFEYYPSKQPKLQIHWKDDTIQGLVRTWYENGVLESEREMSGTKKHGHAFAWYKSGQMMLSEEYEDDKLTKGSYFREREKKPVSKIEQGKGIATLFDSEGRLLKKIPYEKGLPLID